MPKSHDRYLSKLFDSGNIYVVRPRRLTPLDHHRLLLDDTFFSFMKTEQDEKYLEDIDDNNICYFTTVIFFSHPLRLDDQSFKNGTWMALNE